MSLINLKSNIEQLDRFHQLEILKILKGENEILNENNNGTFINLSLISSNSLDKIGEYLLYIKDQEKTLEALESTKEEFKQYIMSKDNKDKNSDSINEIPIST
jgi:hypothetical protein